MHTEVLSFAADPERTTEQAVAALRAGEVVALPTETVYGLAGLATDPEAVARIFAAKERPSFDPLIVHLPDLAWLDRLARIEPPMRALVKQLTEAAWPGPLTLVLPRTDLVPDVVTSGLDTVALRMSAHPVFRWIIQSLGLPLAAPSANRFGRISPTEASHVVAELAGRIPLVVDGGPTFHGVESTILEPAPEGVRVLRPGPITENELSFVRWISPSETVETRPSAPGRLESHYAPATPLLLASEGRPLPGHKCGLLAWEGKFAGEFPVTEFLSVRRDLVEAAAHLFAALRRLDDAGLDYIVAETVPEEGIGIAIMDRLRRAAAKRG